MKDFAIIEAGGKQYRVSVGDKLTIDLMSPPASGALKFDKVLLRSEGGTLSVGQPYVAGAHVAASLIGDFRGEKKIVFKYHSKTRFRKKKGHRQDHTKVLIESV